MVGVTATNADFYTKYLQVPSVAKRGVWDLSLAGWGPDWYGDAAKSFFEPLFNGTVLPPHGQLQVLNNPSYQALLATSTSAAGKLWQHRADVETVPPGGDPPHHPTQLADVPWHPGAQRHLCAGAPAVRPDEYLAQPPGFADANSEGSQTRHGT